MSVTGLILIIFILIAFIFHFIEMFHIIIIWYICE